MSQAETMTSNFFTICLRQVTVNLLFAGITFSVYILHNQTQLPKKALNIIVP